MPDPYPLPMSTTYPSVGGPHTVSTEWNGTETGNEWWNRHKDRVRAATLGDFPIVTGG